MSTKAPVFDKWLNDFFRSYYRHRPVNATFIGKHNYNHLLPDLSEGGVGDCVAEMNDLRERMQSLPSEPLSRAEQIDKTLAEGFLRIQLWEYSSNHFQRGNPSLYTGEAVFGVIGLFLTAHAPLQDRVTAATERMRKIPALLAQGQQNVRMAPRAWTERALHECEGALILFNTGLERLMRDEQIEDRAFRSAAEGAAAAFVDFRSYLSGELAFNTANGYACGDEAFDLLMRHGHFLEVDGTEIAAYAEDALAAAEAHLEAHAADFDAVTVDEALVQLAELHPTAEDYLTQYTELWESCRTAADAHELLTWPDFPIKYVPRPAWVRQAAPYLYFLFYRSPAAFQRPDVHHYLVAPLDETLKPEEQEAFLRRNNDSVIKLNHVIHHGGIGHHVQNSHAFRAASRVGRIAAVDCASRIAMFCGGTMAEGWACYATSLMQEVGFLTPLEAYAEQQSRRRMSARALVDVKLHRGEFTLEEAASFYERRAGMSSAAAHGEAVKNSMFPGAAMMYLWGSDMITKLRREVATREGEAFNLKRFHDRFLAYGSIPVSLIRNELLDAAEVAE